MSRQDFYTDGSASREINDDDNRPHPLDMLVAQKKRIAELEGDVVHLQSTLRHIIATAGHPRAPEGCRLIVNCAKKALGER